LVLAFSPLEAAAVGQNRGRSRAGASYDVSPHGVTATRSLLLAVLFGRYNVQEKLRETLKVNERRDDTTKPGDESRPAPAPGRYYYDDATGYETYRPEDDEGEAPGDEPRAEAD
jgi:hypothetical protein